MTTNKQFEDLNLDQLLRLSAEVDQKIKDVKAEKKVLVWRVTTFGILCTNFRADDYEKAIDFMISKTKEYAMRSCAEVVKEGSHISPSSKGWGYRGMNPEIPYIEPHWVPESEYMRDWEKDLEK